MWHDLLRALGGFRQDELLQQFSKRLPNTIRDEILFDGAPDVELTVLGGRPAADRLVEPLERLSFPKENLYECASLLDFLLLGYGDERGDHHPAKLAYLSVFYLYCYVLDPNFTQCGATPGAAAILVDAARDSDIDLVASLVRFCLWALSEGQCLEEREDAPIFHLTLAIVCLLEQCNGTIADRLRETVPSLTYYKDAVGAPPELPAHMWAAYWRDLLNLSSSHDPDRIAGAFQLVADAMRTK